MEAESTPISGHGLLTMPDFGSVGAAGDCSGPLINGRVLSIVGGNYGPVEWQVMAL